MYLFATKGYVCIPSTNKIATELYECVLLDPKNECKNIYIQVKKGNEDLDAKDYEHLTKTNNGEVYLLTTEGEVKNEIEGVFVVAPEDIFNFAREKNNQKYLPKKIRTWLSFLKQEEKK